MNLVRNMSNPDRALRSFLVAPAAIVAGVLVGPGSALAIVLYALAGVMLATSAAGFCPLYALARRLGLRGRTLASH